MSTDWAVTTRALFGPGAAEALWPDHARWAPVVLEARETLQQRARSFWLASAFLSGTVRDDLAVLYAFCRAVDDTADDPGAGSDAAARLDRLREELQGRAAPRPLVGALRATARRRRMSLGSAATLIEGVRSDLGPVRIATEDELVRYCYRVAGTVGLLLCGVLEARAEGRPHAVDLGIAMQLTNIARDVREDAGLGRVYLPADWLAAEGITTAAVAEGLAPEPAVARVVCRLLDLADRYYRSADQGIRDLPAAHRPAILIASRLYAAIGHRARRHAAPLRGRVVVPPIEKAVRTAAAIGLALSPRMLGLGPHAPHDSTLHHPIAGWPGSNAEARCARRS